MMSQTCTMITARRSTPRTPTRDQLRIMDAPRPGCGRHFGRVLPEGPPGKAPQGGPTLNSGRLVDVSSGRRQLYWVTRTRAAKEK